MQRDRLFSAVALVIAMAIAIAQPIALFSQENSAKETYEGEALCRTGRGVYPHPTYQPAPEYDNKDRKSKTQGTVALSLMVTKQGEPVDIKVVKTLTPGLDQQAIKCVSRWKFDPVIQDGKPCPARINVEVQFHLY